ncbi:calcium-binding protein [Nocardioides humilatus]|uniref:Calcium-binding protein n=1 Tax=Nocardioides humilatus TaxID=2607660 RepID=A0A5B1LIG7_9ACTN|nr:calcium-binding protein [Nocardioides humilatus]KAA1420236.1 calcium-binding protein [Nocardioides humilatus]
MSAPTTGRRSTKRAVATLLTVTGLVIAPAFVQSAIGKTDPGHHGKGKPQQVAPAAPAGPDCDLNLGDNTKDEFARCSSVVISTSSTPALKGTTTVDVAVTSVADLKGAKLTLLTNHGFSASGATGFSAAGSRPSGVGQMSAMTRTISVTAHRTAHFTFRVTGAKAGLGVIQARLDASNNRYDGGDELSVQLGQPTNLSPRGGLRAVRLPSNVRLPQASAPAGRRITPPLSGPGSLSPQAPNASCATGGFFFYDETNTLQPGFNLYLEVWDDDVVADDLLATAYNGGDGRYNICFESTDGEGGGQEVYIRVITSNVAWRVRDTAASNTNIIFTLPTHNYADPGGTFEFSNYHGGSYNRGLHAYDGLNRLYQWTNGNLDNGEGRQMILNWTPTSTDGTYYSTGSNDIHLAAADPDADHITIHEGAHALMDALYDDDWPPVTNCNPHYIFGPSSTTCAWTEGWAEWVPARVLNDPFFRWADGGELDLENQGWTTYTGAYSDTSEGRIAGALIDLSDSNNEGPWDRYTEGGGGSGSEEIYATMYGKQVSDTLNEYFNTDRAGEGDQGYLARAALFQNTVDYTHRDPLTSTQELVRPSLAVQPSPHRYSYTASSIYWGGVAIRPPGGADYDLALYSDEAMATLMGSSVISGSAIDYVLVDGNHRTGTFFPRAYLYTGSGAYTIEEVTGNQSIGIGQASFSFAAADIIQPFDVSVAGGQTQYIGIQPSGTIDVSIHAHVSDGTAATTTQGRSQYAAASNSAGVGGAEYLTYSAASSDWTGLVILNESATGGGYTVYRDTAVPSGASVSVDGGNPQTYDTTVDLALAATAANTPVTEMQISTDGVFDSEPWVPYSTTGTATLPAGPGTKTVSVHYRSAAGAISTTATDDINLVSVPTCDGLTATVFGNGTVTGTPGNDVIVGGPGPDSIVGQGGNDTICGLGGNDAVNDGPGADEVFGENGNDVITQPAAVDAGDVFDGGTGTDQVSYGGRSGDVNVTIDITANDGAAGENDYVMTSVENITTGGGNDTVIGSPVANRLIGNAGNDTLSGADGNDYLAGVGGADTLRGVNGNDTILAGDGDDIVDDGNAANGTDVIKGGAGFDKITYGARTTAVAIKLTGVASSGAGGENDKLIGFEWAVGGSGGDNIVGHTTADTLSGMAGDDTMMGNGGDDTMTGGAGADNLNGGNGQDDLDTVDGVNGNDTANGGAGTDTATTDAGDIKISIP